jgi:hypothetical protein
MEQRVRGTNKEPVLNKKGGSGRDFNEFNDFKVR